MCHHLKTYPSIFLQAQYLLHLLIPYSTEDSGGNVTASDGSLPPHMTDPLLAMERILRVIITII